MVELNPFKGAQTISWRFLNLTRATNLAQSVREHLVPSERAKTLLRDEVEQTRQRDEAILRGVGELALLVRFGKRSVDQAALDSVWSAVVSADSGVELADVFDPQQAACIRQLMPVSDEATAPKVQAPDLINNDEI